MRAVDKIIWHCTASGRRDQMNVESVSHLHTAPTSEKIRWGIYSTTGKGYKQIGYHWLVSDSGIVYPGRDELIAGAHCVGHNQNSISLALFGDIEFPEIQIESAITFTRGLLSKYNLDFKSVYGHYELNETGKTCPNINMDYIRSQLCLKHLT